MLPPYRKPHLDVPGRIALLRSRGMEITDTETAARYLARVGYYRLSGYWHPLRQSRSVIGPDGKRVTEVLDDFRQGVRFSQGVALYVFDKRLRLLFLDAIERIEVAMRVHIALLLSVHDPWAHRNPAFLPGSFAKRMNPATRRTTHQDWLARLDHLAARSKDQFVRHFTAQYSGPLPIWIAIELWDFGMLSTFLAGMALPDQARIGMRYGVQRPELLTSWMRGINLVRNICAHHGRLWNRSLADQPKPPRLNELPMLDHLATDPFAQSRLYGVAAPMQLLLRTINPTTTWPGRLRDHLATFPLAPGVAMAQTGFPVEWDALPLWT